MTSWLPPDLERRLRTLPGGHHSEALALAYESTLHVDGIVVLLAPTVPTALAVASGASLSTSRIEAPRVYIVDPRCDHLAIIFQELANENLAGEATLYHGTIQEFFRDIPLAPSLICVDSASPDSADLNSRIIRNHLPAGAQLTVLHTTGDEFRRAIEAGLLTSTAPQPGGIILQATNQCRAKRLLPTRSARVILQGNLHERYFLQRQNIAGRHTPVSDLTVNLRRELARHAGLANGYGPWPYATESAPLPPSLPSGKPWPKISVITPSYNQGPYIEETLLSVLNQGYPNVEHIVMDGGSIDATPSILERYRDRLSHVTSEPDNGQSHAINKGMALATGEILTWLNSDDMLAPGALAAVALAFDTHEADMIAGICRLYRNGILEAQHITSCADGPLPLNDLLDLDNGWNAGQFFYQPEVMFTRELWQRAGGYVNDWLHYSMDYDLWLRFAQAGARLHVIGRPVAWFRLHDEQKTHVAARFQAELAVCRQDFLSRSDIQPVTTPPVAPLRQKLRITLLNDIGPFYGAGIAHVRMARALAWAGHEVSLVSILDRSILGFESTDYAVQDVLERVMESKPDLVIVGNLHAAGVDPFLIQLLCERYPTVLVMHDFWAVTGRCAYPGTCQRFQTRCDHTCPTADEYPALPPDQIAEAWSKKRLILNEPCRPDILTYSRWAETVTRSAFSELSQAHSLPPQIGTFQLSFPLDIFRPRDRRLCRDLFDLPHDRFIVLLPGSLTNPRKGGLPFLQALAPLELPNLLVVTLSQPITGTDLPVEVRQLGQINSQFKIAMLNSAADVVVVASTEETFGQVAVEAIACGTPVVGYPASGLREAIRDGVTGILAKSLDPVDLAAAVQFLYTRRDIAGDLARWGRLYVENEWSEFSASRHLHQALRKIDEKGRFRLSRMLRFLPAEPVLPHFQTIARARDQWRPLYGFSLLQQGSPEHRLDRYRWAFPSASAEIIAREAGLHRILIEYRNPHPGQGVQIGCNGRQYGTITLVHTGFSSGRRFVLNLHLEIGPNALEMRFSNWAVHPETRQPQAIIVTDVIVEPVASCDEIARQTTAEQMVGEVWSPRETRGCGERE